MNCSCKIFLSHSAIFQHYYINKKIFILISQRYLLIYFLSVLAVFSSETLLAFRHVILVKNKVELMLKLNLMLIRSDIYFCFTNNFILIFSSQSHESLSSLLTSRFFLCT